MSRTQNGLAQPTQISQRVLTSPKSRWYAPIHFFQLINDRTSIIEEFRGLAWSEVKPKHLDYANTQILLIGEHTDKAVEATKKDQKHDKDSPKEELEKLEHEDELRVEHLNGECSLQAV